MKVKTEETKVKTPPDGSPKRSPDGTSAGAAVQPGVPSRWRVFAYRILLLGFGFFSLVGWMRFIASLVSWYWLNYAHIWPGPLYLAFTGLLWGLAGLTGVIWLWLRRRWARLAGMAVALFLALTYWLDYALTARFMVAGNNLPFALLVTLLGLAFVLLMLRPFDELRLVLRRK